MAHLGYRPTGAAAPALLIIVILAVQYFIATAFQPRLPTDTSSDYSLLAQAFQHHQLSLLQEPDPALALLPDPYDFNARAGIPFITDALYYRSKYYLYWGPVPGLVLAIVEPILGRTTNDGELTVAATFVMTLAGAGVILQVRRLWFSDQPAWLPLAAVTALGLGTPTLFVLAGPAIYQAAIMSGQAFLIAGLFFALGGLARRAAALQWTLAGVCWAAAFGSRVTLGVPVAVLTAAFACHLFYRWKLAHENPWPLIPLAGFSVVTVLLLGLYNLLRFGSWFETGLQFQLSGGANDLTNLFSPRYVAGGLLQYVVLPLSVSQNALGRVFAYLPWLPEWTARIISRLASFRYTEPVFALPWSTPYVLLALGTALAAVKGAQDGHGCRVCSRQWLAAVSLLSVGAAALPLLLFVAATERYVADFMPLAIVSAFIGSNLLWLRSEGKRRGLAIAIASLSVSTVIVGAVLGCWGYNKHLKVHNPQLYAAVVGHLPVRGIARLD